jgi:hypothetical protein
MKAALSLLFASSLAVVACGKTGAVSPDAGPPDGGALATRGSFLCSASLRSSVQGGPLTSDFDATGRFTLAIDPDAKRAVAGGGGTATEIALTLDDDGRIFRSSQPFVAGASLATCPKLVKVTYDSLAFLPDSLGGLTGMVTGTARLTKPGVPAEAPFQANLFCQPDKDPPRLVVPDGVKLDDPLTHFQLWTSKPLPASALARIVGTDGAVSGLVPEVIEGRVPLIASFAKANVTLTPGQTFQALFSDDVVDLDGRLAPMGVALALGTIAPAPLLEPDGFESATNDTAGGATIFTTLGLPIAGKRTAYIGLPMSPRPTGEAVNSKLFVRMAVPAGASKLTFTYRELSYGFNDDPGFVQLGSVGRAPGAPIPIPVPATFEPVKIDTQTFSQSEIATMTVPLQDDIGPEVIVVIQTGPAVCDDKGRPGLLIDELRLQ